MTLPTRTRSKITSVLFVAMCCLVTIYLLIQPFSVSAFSSHVTSRLLDALLETQVQQGTVINHQGYGWDDWRGKGSSGGDDGFVSLFPDTSRVEPNPYLSVFVSCKRRPNEFTGHVRLLGTRLQEIRFTTLEQDKKKEKEEKSYFNPAMIALPAYGQSKYQYILLSRLVTTGLHQEAHICPAVARFRSQSTSQMASSGGNNDQVLQCAQPPQRLNIPHTPSFRCVGRWAAFSDIPGFHDPRLFWSGKAEPLIIINSGSASPGGCVGLWIVDLRAVLPAWKAWVAGGGGAAEDGTDEETTMAAQQEEESNAKHNRPRRELYGQVMPDAKMSYPHLTELTKNPPSSRNLIEKNWVIFFPKAEEQWIMYNIVGHGVDELSEDAVEFNTNNQVDGAIHPDSLRHSQGATYANETMKSFPNIHARHIRRPFHTLEAMNRHDSRWVEESVDTDKQGSKVAHQHPRQIASGSDNGHPTNSFAGSVQAQRTLAKLIGAGLTTSNLTAANELPCFSDDYNLPRHQGRWHQGSNALRLVLCYRSGQEEISVDSTAKECSLSHKNENSLVKTGRVVHFMVLHRKFNNLFGLPMRYERHFVVWESRWPFRIIGISKYPILFDGERAWPWTEEENWADTQGEHLSYSNGTKREHNRWKNAYFAYTPSLAWAWRSEQSLLRGRRESDLGTGYLDDYVMVGIGLDDARQGYVRVQAQELLSCLRLCPDFISNTSSDEPEH